MPSPADTAAGGRTPPASTAGCHVSAHLVLAWLAVLALIALAVVVRLPILSNSGVDFNSDEAVNALVMRHFVERRELVLYNWDATYYGIAEGLLALPFVDWLGFEPLAFRLAAVTGLVLLMVLTYVLGRRAFGTPAALVASGCLAVFSPQVVQWSTLASGGFLLTIAWGTLALLVLDHLRRHPAPARFAGLGVVLGLGLYIYELFLVYVALLAASAFVASHTFALLRSAPGHPAGWRTLARALPRAVLSWTLFAAGFVLGWSPKLVTLLMGGLGTKVPAYSVASVKKILANADLLVTGCIPAFFGVNPAGDPALDQAVGAVGGLTRVLGGLLLLLVLVAWSASLYRCRGELAALVRLRSLRLGIEPLLVLLVPWTALAFLLSSNPHNVLSNRYLLPWLTSLPLLVGAWIARLGARHLALAVLPLTLLVGLPAVQTARTLQARGYLGPHFEVLHPHSAMEDLVSHLEARGIRGGYASYWIAYQATMMSDEAVVFAPFHDWSRYRPYERFVDGLADPVYVFHPQEPQHRQFLRLLAARGEQVEPQMWGPYVVYFSTEGRPLVPMRRVVPAPLRDPRAEIEILSAPVAAAPGEELAILLRIVNTSGAWWSASGDTTGRLRVAVAYHWFDEDDHPIETEGSRILLPGDTAPGESVTLDAGVQVPARTGELRLVVTMVQEGVAWFDHAAGTARQHFVRVREAEPLPESGVIEGSPTPAGAPRPPG